MASEQECLNHGPEDVASQEEGMHASISLSNNFSVCRIEPEASHKEKQEFPHENYKVNRILF